MKINPQLRTVTLEHEDCINCKNWASRGFKPGMSPGYMTCPDCKGTCRGPRGGANRCRKCFRGQVLNTDPSAAVICEGCNGTAKVPETMNSRVTSDFYKSFLNITRVFIVPQHRSISFNESYLGIGIVCGIMDYSDRWKRYLDNPSNATEIIPKIFEIIQKDSFVQLSHIAKMDKDSKVIDLCSGLYALVHRDGFSVRASYMADGSDVCKKASTEPSEQLGMMIGVAVYEEGGNGTLAAAGVI